MTRASLSTLLIVVLLSSLCLHARAIRWSRITPEDSALYSIRYHTASGAFEPGCTRTFSFLSLSSRRLAFNLTVQRLSDVPLISSQYPHGQYGSSVNDYNYNAAYVPLPHGRHALLVRTQNSSSRFNAPASPSQLFLAFDATGKSQFAPITQADLNFFPSGPTEDFGTEDPRVVYNHEDRRWWLWYSAVRSKPDVHSDLSVASTDNITDPSRWVRHGKVRTDGGWSKSGALLLRPGNTSYLYFGDSNNGKGMELATTENLINYTIASGIWLPIRPEPYFDNVLVEGGPAPHRLSTGPILMLHNSAGHMKLNGSDWSGYHIGFVLLDQQSPATILFRSPVPILSCELGWEKGEDPWLKLTPFVVFTEGSRRYEEGGKDSFLFYYGAADSVVGAAVATFSFYDSPPPVDDADISIVSTLSTSSSRSKRVAQQQ